MWGSVVSRENEQWYWYSESSFSCSGLTLLGRVLRLSFCLTFARAFGSYIAPLKSHSYLGSSFSNHNPNMTSSGMVTLDFQKKEGIYTTAWSLHTSTIILMNMLFKTSCKCGNRKVRNEGRKTEQKVNMKLSCAVLWLHNKAMVFYLLLLHGVMTTSYWGEKRKT